MKQNRDLLDKEPERLIRFAERNRVRLRVIEIVVLIAIVTLVGAASMPRLVGRTVIPRSDAVRGDIAALCEMLELFKQDNGSYPSSLIELITGEVKYFKASGVPPDPWGNQYVYRCPGQQNKGGYDLISYGPDGVEGGGDDITSWNLQRQADSI